MGTKISGKRVVFSIRAEFQNFCGICNFTAHPRLSDKDFLATDCLIQSRIELLSFLLYATPIDSDQRILLVIEFGNKMLLEYVRAI